MEEVVCGAHSEERVTIGNGEAALWVITPLGEGPVLDFY